MDLLSNFKPGEFTHYICALKIPLSIRWHLGFQPYIWLHFFSLMFKNRVQYNIRTFIYCSRRWQHAEIWYEPFFMQYFVRPTSKHHALKNYVIFLTIILLDPRWLSYLFWNNDSKKKNWIIRYISFVSAHLFHWDFVFFEFSNYYSQCLIPTTTIFFNLHSKF